MMTVENVFKLTMQKVHVEKDYGLGVDTVPWAADTRPHAAVVFAKNMKAFSWCVCLGQCGGSLMIQLALLSQCFLWMSNMKEYGDPVIH